jgi:hypothetical protein
MNILKRTPAISDDAQVRAAATVLANARSAKRGVPAVANVLDLLSVASPDLYAELLETARDALVAARKADKTGEAVDLLASGLKEPARAAETARHHAAIFEAMNASHTNGEQDSLTVFEAIARFLAQLIAGIDEETGRGILQYVCWRAVAHVPDVLAKNAAAEHREAEPPSSLQ